MPKPASDVAATITACIDHACDLLDSAKAVQAAGHPHIAYHLATLALEELGRRQLLALQTAVADEDDPPPWMGKATTDHVKKLFWCLYGLSNIDDVVDQARFFELMKSAAEMHDRRVAGLYVDAGDSGVQIPSKAISAEQGQNQIDMAAAFLGVAELKPATGEMTDESKELQSWFLSVFEDPERRKRAMTTVVFDKLKELKDVVAWTRWLTAEFERNDAEMESLLQQELRRGVEVMGKGEANKDKWQVRFRVETESHSIRPAALKKWNAVNPWLKLTAVQGARSKKEMIVELTFKDNIPLQVLWNQSLGFANHFIMTLNMATSGFWWWVLPRHKTRFYDKVVDLENKCEVALDQAQFLVFQGPPRALTAVHIENMKRCFLALPGPMEAERLPAYVAYISGLLFASLVDIHCCCEGLALQQFLQSLKLLLIEAKSEHVNDPLREQVGRMLTEKYPDLDAPARAGLLDHVAAFEAMMPVRANVVLGDVYLIKLLCEEVFRNMILPTVLKQRLSPKLRPGEPRSSEPSKMGPKTTFT